ncbi:hypothetical protein C8R46DRAFT_1084542 [Mycena filopes]|nr:hypothetical protein C8R46DRAFT_1084542 [Mycena filopes]
MRRDCSQPQERSPSPLQYMSQVERSCAIHPKTVKLIGCRFRRDLRLPWHAAWLDRDWLIRARKAPVTLQLDDLQHPDLHTSMKTLLPIIVGLSRQCAGRRAPSRRQSDPVFIFDGCVFLGKLPLLEKLVISILPSQEPAPDDDSDDTPAEIDRVTLLRRTETAPSHPR